MSRKIINFAFYLCIMLFFAVVACWIIDATTSFNITNWYLALAAALCINAVTLCLMLNYLPGFSLDSPFDPNQKPNKE